MPMTWAERAKAVIPQGANTLSKQHVRYGAGTPPLISHGDGPWIWDVDGNRYYDYCAGLAAVTLGHRHPNVMGAIVDAAGSGVTHLPTRREIEVSEEFCQIVGAEQVRWVSTGSEATEAAIRIARIATGRDVVLSIGYHSWFSTFSAAKPNHPGCPEVFREALWDVPYNDIKAAHAAFQRSDSRIAAVIVEPTALDAPTPTYLPALRDLCRMYGALLIFDEIICGFRFDVRGGAGLFGVEPDLQCYGKTITNGAVPAAAVVGSEDLMRHAWPISGTANAHPLAMAAIGAVLDVYQREFIIEQLRDEGSKLWDAMHRVQAPGVLFDGWPIRPRIRFEDDVDSVALTLFVQTCAQRGVLWQPSGANVMAVTEGRRDANAVIQDTAGETGRAWVADPEKVRATLAGAPISPTGLRA